MYFDGWYFETFSCGYLIKYIWLFAGQETANMAIVKNNVIFELSTLKMVLVCIKIYAGLLHFSRLLHFSLKGPWWVKKGKKYWYTFTKACEGRHYNTDTYQVNMLPSQLQQSPLSSTYASSVFFCPKINKIQSALNSSCKVNHIYIWGAEK